MRRPCLISACSTTQVSVGASRVALLAIDSGVIEGISACDGNPRKCCRCRKRRCRC